MSEWPPPLQCLIDLCSADLGRGHPLTTHGVDADELVALADAHRLTIIADRSWHEMAARSLAPPPPMALTERANRGRTRALLAATHLVRLAEAFASADITWRAIKGPVLCVQLYGDAVTRIARDLDVIVPKAQLGAAITAAASAGWDAPVHWRDLMRITGRYDMALRARRPGQPLLELHAALGPPYAQLALDPFAEATGEIVSVFGADIPTLTGPALTTYVAWHGARGLWYRLGWLVDLARLLPRHDDDARRTLAFARRCGAEPALRAGAGLADRLFATAPPPWPAADPAIASRVDAMIGWALERLRLGVDAPSVWSPPGSYRWLWREVAQQASPWRAALSALLQVSRPTIEDAQALGIGLPLAVHQLARPYFLARRVVRAGTSRAP